jgi:imidazolonepropionase-like amidohydrolase
MKKWMIVLVLVAAGLASANFYVPGKKQDHPILLKGGDLYTVKSGILLQTDLLFDKGRITQIGKNLPVPTDGEVVDVTGRRVYPGLIDAVSTLGLVEIGAVRATRDESEVGGITPEVQSQIAYNPDSEVLPVVRSNGITTALVAPTGGVICGRSSLINLDGWTREDAMEKANVGLHVNWPMVSVSYDWWDERTPDAQKKENAENLRKLNEAFESARAYSLAKKADPNIKIDQRWEAMLPVFTKELPVFIAADDSRQMEQAVRFARKQDIRIIIVGAREAWRVTELLKANNVPVILGRVHLLPLREDDDYDISYKLPRLLSEAGVKFCFSYGYSNWPARSLPFQAAQAVAFGLPPDQALRGLTLSTAEILGVEKDLGSLEVGKKATIVVSDGDILDPPTSKVIWEFIEGREVDLNNRQKELFDKYSAKVYAP